MGGEASVYIGEKRKARKVMNLKGKKRAYQISTIILLIAITLICI